jgi:hypothetical protein
MGVGIDTRKSRGIKLMEIEESHLLELIHWSRRYCDSRSTYAPTRFNWMYEYIVQLNPGLKEVDPFDPTLKDKGKYWPWAQDGMYDEKTGAYDARPMKPRNIAKDNSNGLD